MPATPNPRRNSSGGPSRSSATRSGASRALDSPPRAGTARTVDLSAGAKTTSPKSAPPKPVDAGSKRRALKKKRARQGNLVAWTVAGAITVVIAGASAGVWTEFQSVKGRVAEKRATLADLTAQLESGQRRLRALTSASGKERVLVENGFIKPGERLLLFPKASADKK